MKYLSLLLLVLPLLLSNAGCSVALKEPNQHDFGWYDAKFENKPEISVDAPKWLWSDHIHYRLLYASPTQLRFYTQDRWIASPPELFNQQLASIAKTANHVLKIRLLDFEQQFDAPKQARVVMRFTAEAYTEDGKQLIGTKQFNLNLPAANADAEGAVNGFSKLTKQAVDEINVWLAGLPTQSSSTEHQQ